MRGGFLKTIRASISCFAKSRRSGRGSGIRYRRPLCEPLEDRRLLSTGGLPKFGFALGLGGSEAEHSTSLATDAAGSILVAGDFQGTADFDPGPGSFHLTSAGGMDVFVAKYSSAGALTWAKRMGGTGFFDAASKGAADGSGNVYVTGGFEGEADFDPDASYPDDRDVLISAGCTDVFLSKLDASGNFLWAKRWGGTGGEIGLDLAVDHSGNVIVTSQAEWRISKLDASGNLAWTKGIPAYGIAVDAVGDVYAVGAFQGTADFDPDVSYPDARDILTSAGGRDAFVLKLDASGNFVWVKRMGGPWEDSFSDVAVDRSGNVYANGLEAFVAKLDASGDLIWAKHLWGSGGAPENVVWGEVDIDPFGNVYSAKYVFGGANSGAFVSKLDPSGNVVWVKGMGAPGAVVGCFAFYGSAYVYAAGTFAGTADFDPDASYPDGRDILTSVGESDVFIAKLIQGGPRVTGSDPLPGSQLSEGPSQIRIEFDTRLAELSAETISNYALIASNHDGQFGDGDDVPIPIDTAVYNPNDLSVTLVLNGGAPLPLDTFQFRIDGTGGLTDEAGNPLDGEWPGVEPGFPSGDGAAGGEFMIDFVAQDPSPKPMAPNGVRSLADYEARIGEPGVLLEDHNVQMWVPLQHVEHSLVIFRYLSAGHEELSNIFGGHDLSTRFSVEHYPPGSPYSWGGTDARGTIRYGYANLVDDSPEWNNYGVPHMVGYYEEMAHCFICDTGADTFYEALGMIIGEETALRAAWNPHVEQSVASGYETFQQTTEYYLAHDEGPPGVADNIWPTRVLAHAFKAEIVDQYGWDAIGGAFEAMREAEYPMRQYASAHKWGAFLDYLAPVTRPTVQNDFADYGLPIFSWVGEPGYGNDGVEVIGQSYQYRIRCFDREGNQPSNVTLYLYSDFGPGVTTYSMTLTGGDAASGWVYEKTVDASAGSLRYAFAAKDGKHDVFKAVGSPTTPRSTTNAASALWIIGEQDYSWWEFNRDPHTDPDVINYAVGDPWSTFPYGLGTDIGNQRSVVNIEFEGDLSAGGTFIVGWSPGGSAAWDSFRVEVDSQWIGDSESLQGQVPDRWVTTRFDVPPLPQGSHVIKLIHSKQLGLGGDGLYFDFLALEELGFPPPIGWPHEGQNLWNTNFLARSSSLVTGHVTLDNLWDKPHGSAVRTCDLDGDGDLEVIYLEDTGRARPLVALDGDGTELWRRDPVADSQVTDPNAQTWRFDLADIDGDDDCEIVINVNCDVGWTGDKPNRILIYDGDGTLLYNWAAEDGGWADPLVGDVTGDRLPEIVAGLGDYRREHGAYVYGVDGTLIGEPFLTGEALNVRAIGDIDGDGVNEALFTNFASHNGQPEVNGVDDMHAHVVAVETNEPEPSQISVDGKWVNRIGTCSADVFVTDFSSDGTVEVVALRNQDSIYYPGPNEVCLKDNHTGETLACYTGPHSRHWKGFVVADVSWAAPLWRLSLL